MRIRLNAPALQWFEDRNISFHNRFKPRLREGDLVSFLDDVAVEPYIGVHSGRTIAQMGFMSYTNSLLPADIVIGRYCSLAAGLTFPRYRHPIEHVSTSIFTHDRPTDLVVRAIRDMRPGYAQFHPNPQKGPVTIGHDVWIGQSAAINAGVTIGTGAVVAANSVVTRPVAPYEIVGGNPAQRIRMRFPEEIVARLLSSEWWRYRFTDFEGLEISDPVAFLDGFARRKPSLEPYCPPPIRLAEVAPLADPA